MIHDKKILEYQVLPKFFKEAKYTSFNRRLKRWNFVIQRHGHKKSSYFHPNFIRDDLDNISQMSPAPQIKYGVSSKKHLQEDSTRTPTPSTIRSQRMSVHFDAEEGVAPTTNVRFFSQRSSTTNTNTADAMPFYNPSSGGAAAVQLCNIKDTQGYQSEMTNWASHNSQPQHLQTSMLPTTMNDYMNMYGQEYSYYDHLRNEYARQAELAQEATSWGSRLPVPMPNAANLPNPTMPPLTAQASLMRSLDPYYAAPDFPGGPAGLNNWSGVVPMSPPQAINHSWQGAAPPGVTSAAPAGAGGRHLHNAMPSLTSMMVNTPTTTTVRGPQGSLPV